MSDPTKLYAAALVTELAEHTLEPESRVREFLKALGEVVNEQLAVGCAVTLPGIGKLEPHATKARTGRNPRTGKELAIPAGRRAAFTAAAGLKRALEAE